MMLVVPLPVKISIVLGFILALVIAARLIERNAKKKKRRNQ
jgi:hypothetical protein